MVAVLEQEPKVQEPKKQESQGKETPKPKDLSKVSTDDLMNEFAELKAKLEVDLNQAAAKAKGFPPLTQGEMEESKAAQAALVFEEQSAKRRAKKDDAAYRKDLETEYRAVEAVVNDPKEFQKAVDKKAYSKTLLDFWKQSADAYIELSVSIDEAARKELKREKAETIVRDAATKTTDAQFEKFKKNYADSLKITKDEEKTEELLRNKLEKNIEKIKGITPDSKLFKDMVEDRKRVLENTPPPEKDKAPDKSVGMASSMHELLQTDIFPTASDTKLAILWPEQTGDKLALPQMQKGVKSATVG